MLLYKPFVNHKKSAQTLGSGEWGLSEMRNSVCSINSAPEKGFPNTFPSFRNVTGLKLPNDILAVRICIVQRQKWI